ncbi:MAG: hypothetical protein AAFY20_13795 [Cyanobacteria bacterium J06639_14]
MLSPVVRLNSIPIASVVAAAATDAMAFDKALAKPALEAIGNHFYSAQILVSNDST